MARSGIGIAVRTGAPKPDIRTVAALKRALLDTPSIAYNKEASSGIYFASLLERLGIAEAMQPKTTFGTGFVAELVAKGEADMAVQLMSDHMAVPGVELVGPLPAEVQHYVVFTAGVGADVKDSSSAKELITFLTAPSAVPVLKPKGLEPGRLAVRRYLSFGSVELRLCLTMVCRRRPTAYPRASLRLSGAPGNGGRSGAASRRQIAPGERPNPVIFRPRSAADQTGSRRTCPLRGAAADPQRSATR